MIRATVPDDTLALLTLAEETGVFKPLEIEALKEVLDDFHAGLPDHRCVTAEQDDGIVGHADDVVGHHRNLAAAVGAVDHIGRDAQAGHVAPEPFHDFESLPHRGTEVTGPDHGVAVE